MAKQRTPPPDARKPADEDSLAFRAAVSDVKPLAHTLRAVASNKPKSRQAVGVRTRGPHAAQDLEEAMPLIATPPPGEVASEPASFQRPGVRAQVLRRLRRGLIPIEGDLDLHGLSQIAARGELADFLQSSRDAGRRSVRIVHGKGSRSGLRGPVLKVAVDQWLRRHPDVLAFTSARAIDGGTGALYVLLKV